MQVKSLQNLSKGLLTALILIFLCFIGPSTKAQYITLNDSAFANWLSHNGYSHCISGSTLDTTCADTSMLSSIYLYNNPNIHDVTGIKYFTHLSNLWMYNMVIDSLPLLPPNLTYLTICDIKDSNNHKLPPLPASLKTFSVYGSHSGGADTANYYDSLPTLPNSLVNFFIYNARVHKMPARLPDSLYEFYVGSSKIDSLPTLPNNIVTLDLYNDTLPGLPAFPGSLKYLYLYSMHGISSLPTLPPYLNTLDLWSDSLITSLPSLPSTLQYLYCYNQPISSLPSVLPSGLIWLYVYNCNLTSLPALPSSLRYLYVPDNHITTLPTLPDSLYYLSVSNNVHISLPATLPDSLTYFVCENDSLTKLPAFPAHLNYVMCDNNLIDTLPSMPTNLYYINCNMNRLTYLPTLPAHMYYLDCSTNNITSLPALPSTMYYLTCGYNRLLTGIPDLPKTLYFLDLSHDVSIHCLPVLNNGMTLYFDSTAVSCVPNYGPLYSIPSIGYYPLCAPGGSCEVGWNITGHVYKDSLSTCTYDTIDPVYTYVRVLLYAKDTLSQITYSTLNGGYTFRTTNYDTFVCSVDTAHVSYRVKCPTADTLVGIISAADSLKQHADFALECKSGYDGAIWNIYAWNWYFQPGHTSEVAISGGDISKLYGLHCLSGIGGKIVAYIHGPVTYDSFPSYSLTPSSANNDSIVWTVSDFGSVNPYTAFHFKLHTDTTATWGDTVNVTAHITLSTTDADSTNNSLSQRFWVFSSWDPNSKEVYPTTPHSSNDWITYTIHFQNTGKTPADNIHINDTLDKNLDPNTFEVIASDHPVHTHMLPGGIVQFYFSNINLPDSSSDTRHSTGYVKYRLKMKSSVAFGTAIKNTAYIYFDYNKPVATNTAVSTLTHANASTGVSGVNNFTSDLLLYPNPARDIVTLKFNSPDHLMGVEIQDITGRLLATVTNNTKSNTYKLNMSNYPDGVYLIKVYDSNGNSITKKIVLSR